MCLKKGGDRELCVSGWRGGREGGNCLGASSFRCSSKKNSMKWLSKLSEWYSPEHKLDSRKPKSGDSPGEKRCFRES